MSKHTPGPWAYSMYVNHYEQPELAGWASTVYADDNFREDDICKMKYEFDKETAEANARLIAAAPDLLAACEALLDGTCCDLHERFTRVVAKAKGGAT